MSLKVKDYKQLDGTMLRQVCKVRDGVLRRFDKTPYPENQTDVICPHFMLLAWANGCPYNCAWCYLKGTFRFKEKKPNGRVPLVFKERSRLEKAMHVFVEAKLPAEIINTGELSDSLMQETSGIEPFSSFIIRQVKGTPHRILFLTKSTNIENFLKNEWQKHAILSWSINAEAVAKRWEHYTPTVQDRLTAASRAVEAGYEVRLRIDPMVAIEGWQGAYGYLVDLIYKLKAVPERVTLGCLRGLTSTIVNASDKSWVPYLTESSSWGKKPPLESRLAMYRNVLDSLWSYGFDRVGICKDTVQVWNSLGMKFENITCNCVR